MTASAKTIVNNPVHDRSSDLGDDIFTLVAGACAADPDAPALIFEDGVVVSRRALWDGALAFAGYLQARVRPGERIAIMSSNRAEFMMVWLAAIACRAVLVSLNPAARSHDAGHIVRDSGARIAVVEAAHEEMFAGFLADSPDLAEVVVLSDREPEGLAAYRGTFFGDRLPEVAQDVTNVYYTSGTTGPPKGCMVDHAYWLRFTGLVRDLYGLGSSDRILCCLQFFYNDPPWQLLASLAVGAPLVVMRRFSVSRYWQVVRAHDVTVIFGIASTASLLLKAPDEGHDREHKVRLAIQIGIPPALHSELVARWGVPWVEGYGLTETGLVVAMPLEHADAMVGSGSIGLACPGAEVRVVDADGTEVHPGEVGEFVVRAPGLMRGYLNRPEATAETMRGGWLHTGDLGRADEHGFLYFQGRMKDVIRRSGENIAAAEVENVLRSHPKVSEVAAVPAPDPLRGEEVKVHVLLAAGESAESCGPDALVTFAAERLARYKIPRYFEFRAEEFERTPSMRVKKEGLDRSTTAPAVWDREGALGW